MNTSRSAETGNHVPSISSHSCPSCGQALDAEARLARIRGLLKWAVLLFLTAGFLDLVERTAGRFGF
jgi:hypothetical protein